jgi:hypothetical protein
VTLLPKVFRKDATLPVASPEDGAVESVPETTTEETADERTPLIPTSHSSPSSQPSGLRDYLLYVLAPGVVALLIALIKPVQRVIIGEIGEKTSGSWQSIGSGLLLLGGAFAVLETVAIGAAVRGSEGTS